MGFYTWDKLAKISKKTKMPVSEFSYRLKTPPSNDALRHSG